MKHMKKYFSVSLLAFLFMQGQAVALEQSESCAHIQLYMGTPKIEISEPDREATRYLGVYFSVPVSTKTFSTRGLRNQNMSQVSQAPSADVLSVEAFMSENGIPLMDEVKGSAGFAYNVPLRRSGNTIKRVDIYCGNQLLRSVPIDAKVDENAKVHDEENHQTALVELLLNSSAFARFKDKDQNPYIVRAQNTQHPKTPGILEYTETFLTTHYAGTTHFEERARAEIKWAYRNFFGHNYPQANSNISHIHADTFGGLWVLGQSYTYPADLGKKDSAAIQTSHRMSVVKYSEDLALAQQAGFADLMKWREDGVTPRYGKVVFAGQKDVRKEYGIVHPTTHGEFYAIVRWGVPESTDRQYVAYLFSHDGKKMIAAGELDIEGEIIHSYVLGNGAIQVVSKQAETVVDDLADKTLTSTRDKSIHLYHVKHTAVEVNGLGGFTAEHRGQKQFKNAAVVGASFEYLKNELFIAYKDYSVKQHHNKPDLIIENIALDARVPSAKPNTGGNQTYLGKDAHFVQRIRLPEFTPNLKTIKFAGQYLLMTGSGFNERSKQHRHFVLSLDAEGYVIQHWLPAAYSIDVVDFQGRPPLGAQEPANYLLGGHRQDTESYWQYQSGTRFEGNLFESKVLNK